ncbi:MULTISPECIES: hypothetical protein [unclassified Arthrobacter]|uniref:hypothetical protein n=1 Tax=unclassified Arthrobacter TaxID=235627 RepID=UPI0002EB8113|nr:MULTISPECIES: hypothetical protein [unclassified Arthrobacter]
MTSPHDGVGSDSPLGVRLRSAEELARRLDKPMGILGIIFLFIVLGQVLAEDPTLVLVFSIVGWLFWVIFVGEFLLRAYIASFSAAFWRKNWWQVVFLLVPFLRFFRALQAFRMLRAARFARFGGILSASVRGSRSAGRLLSGRIGWLAAVTAVVILAASQLLYATGSHESYTDALFEASMATITGTGITPTDHFARALQVLLAIYSVAVFATLAGSLGAFFLRDQSPTVESGQPADGAPPLSEDSAQKSGSSPAKWLRDR